MRRNSDGIRMLGNLFFQECFVDVILCLKIFNKNSNNKKMHITKY